MAVGREPLAVASSSTAPSQIGIPGGCTVGSNCQQMMGDSEPDAAPREQKASDSSSDPETPAASGADEASEDTSTVLLLLAACRSLSYRMCAGLE